MYKQLFICLLICTLVRSDPLSEICGDVLNLLSVLGTPFNGSAGCAANSCGTSSGTGYVDLACNLLCIGALYDGGTCTPQDGTPIGSCVCSGYGIHALLLTPEVCNIIGSCVCSGCGYESAITITPVPNAVNGICK